MATNEEILGALARNAAEIVQIERQRQLERVVRSFEAWDAATIAMNPIALLQKLRDDVATARAHLS